MGRAYYAGNLKWPLAALRRQRRDDISREVVNRLTSRRSLKYC